MAQPFNYMLNVPDPTQSVMGGVQSALGVANLVSQRNVAEQKALDMQKARELQTRMQDDFLTLSQNATPSAVVSMMVKYPSLSDNFKRTFDVLSSEQKNARIGQATQVYAAIEANKPDVAQKLLTDYAAAYRNSGQEKDAKALDDFGSLLKISPETAKTSTGLFLASTMGSDKFVETFSKLQADRRDAEMQPSKLTEAESKAQKAAVAAKFAESEAVIDLQKKGWDITKIQEDIKIAKQNVGIAAMNSQIARESNEIKRDEHKLKLQELIAKRDNDLREKIAKTESARASIDNLLNTTDRILSTPLGVVGSAAGPISSRMPTGLQSTADFEGLIENLDAQAFIAQIPNLTGMGALSDAEGKKIGASLQNFSLKQSPERLLENVRETQRLMLKARKNLTAKSGLPETLPDTPFVNPSGSDIEALLKKYGGG